MKSTKTFATLICACLLATSFVAGQEAKSEAKPNSSKTPSTEIKSDETKTRSRRVDAQQPKAAADQKTGADAKKSDENPAKESTPEVTAETATPKEGVAENTSPATPVAGKADPPDSITELREQIEAASTRADKSRLQLQLAEQLVAKGAKQEAIDELHRAAAAEGFDPQGFYNVGNALARLGDSGGAAAAYQKAIEQRKGRYSRAFNNLGVIQLRMGHWDQAYESFMSALRLESFRYAEASYNLGRLYAARGESDLALREWKRAVSVNPEHTAAKQALAGSANFSRVAVAKSSTPPKPVENRPPPAVRSVATPVAKSSGPKVSTPRPLTHTVDPETYRYLQNARTSRDKDRQQDAVTNYQRVISRMGGYFAPANLELSYVLITLKREDEAIAALTPVTQQDGAQYPISYYHLARLYENRGELKLAEENFAKAASFYKRENAQMLVDLSRVREKLGDVEGAVSSLEEYVTLMNQKNLKPDWSDARLAALREKLTATTPKK